jgi:hypothetical protein
VPDIKLPEEVMKAEKGDPAFLPGMPKSLLSKNLL